SPDIRPSPARSGDRLMTIYRHRRPASPLRRRSVALSFIALLLVAGPARAQAPLASNLEPIRTLQTQGLTDDDDETAADIIGMACMPGTGDGRLCMVINDEDRAAQVVAIDGGALTGGEKIRLIGKKPSARTLGNEPQDAGCSEGKAKFKD